MGKSELEKMGNGIAKEEGLFPWIIHLGKRLFRVLTLSILSNVQKS